MRVTGSTKQSSPYLVGVAGGSGSGKTYFAQALAKELGGERCLVVFQDNFYIDQSHRFDFDGGAVNFDHPDSIDFDLLARCLADLKAGRPTSIPVYDFKTHRRQAQPLAVAPKPVVLVDGILIFHSPAVRALLNEMVFFDTPEDLRFLRRLERDVHERGRSPEGVKAQFYRQVKPMHDAFVEPSKAHAGTVVTDGMFASVLEDFSRRLKG